MPSNLNILLALSSAVAVRGLLQPQKGVVCADANVASNAVCCTFFALRDDLQASLYDGGECGEEVHEALRLTFHNAIGFSSTLRAQGKFGGGGADGSIIAFGSVEFGFHANNGIDEIAEAMEPFAAAHTVSFGDLLLVQWVYPIVLVLPGYLSWGRPPPVAASPDLLVPEPFDNVDKILARFKDAGFSPDEVVALLASHSIAAADHVDTTIPGSPFDSTPSTFDSQFFVETQLRDEGEVMSPRGGEMRLQSDSNFARDSATACEWKSFVNNQKKLQTAFAAAMAKMALIGHNARDLVDCSELVPVPLRPNNKPATFPAGKTIHDVEQAHPFPNFGDGSGSSYSGPPPFRRRETFCFYNYLQEAIG